MKVITTVFKWISLVFMGLMSLLNFANVVSRYFLSSTIAWTDEIIVFMFIWISMFGAAYAFLNNAHLGMDLLSISLGKKGNIFLALLSFACVSFMTYFFVVFGQTMVRNQMRFGTVMTGTGWPIWYEGLALPVGGALMFIASLLYTIRRIRALLKGEAK
ncbi:MAG TPA: TRAP transporter small permease [Candidatus Limnocylindria bacterium]|nr:TRAP transporter small permease [Candidatus Limnocylindria bacterium]